jgi:hypothetical protein
LTLNIGAAAGSNIGFLWESYGTQVYPARLKSLLGMLMSVCFERQLILRPV